MPPRTKTLPPHYEDFRRDILFLASFDLADGSDPQPPPAGVSDTVTLYYTDLANNSDKVYTVKLVEGLFNGNISYNVDFAYGKRGGKMTEGTKNKTPLDGRTATVLFSKLVNDKLSEGYTKHISGKPFSLLD